MGFNWKLLILGMILAISGIAGAVIPSFIVVDRTYYPGWGYYNTTLNHIILATPLLQVLFLGLCGGLFFTGFFLILYSNNPS